jgi:alpha-galactosidase/6-phospho-beta-glucosidase family protein
MAINCSALARMMPEVRAIGLCHSVQGTAMQLAKDIGVPDRRHPLPLRRYQPHGVLSDV